MGEHDAVRDVFLQNFKAYEVAESIVRRVYDDTSPRDIDGAYLFAATVENEDSVLVRARDLVDAGVPKILVSRSQEAGGFRGYDAWMEVLHGLPLEGVALEGMLRTQNEANSLTTHAHTKGYRSILLVAPPFHQFRANAYAATNGIRSGPIAFYNQPGIPQDLDEIASHFQGKVNATRRNLISKEVERILQFQEEGDLSSFRNIAAYMLCRGLF